MSCVLQSEQHPKVLLESVFSSSNGSLPDRQQALSAMPVNYLYPDNDLLSQGELIAFIQ
ncbi:hypothetical protein OQX61_16795 [Pedobacter sp. PLR]|uniref:hypothetical protein n=1 Tax=Pedobacter sp. PLR TaxID=2994465 RepID=UPI002246325D|nr:hypothetical protein [Pedobacter sp. PLR]MCX2452937.1 hypothetical protein [Pedobacter sp. PLR]